MLLSFSFKNSYLVFVVIWNWCAIEILLLICCLKQLWLVTSTNQYVPRRLCFRKCPSVIKKDYAISSQEIFAVRRTCASAVLGVVMLSVCLSHACFVTKPNNALRRFWYHVKGQSTLVFWHQQWLVGNVPHLSVWNLHSKWFAPSSMRRSRGLSAIAELLVMKPCYGKNSLKFWVATQNSRPTAILDFCYDIS